MHQSSTYATFWRCRPNFIHTHTHTHSFSLSFIIILYLLFRKMVLKYHLDFKTVIPIFILFDSKKIHNINTRFDTSSSATKTFFFIAKNTRWKKNKYFHSSLIYLYILNHQKSNNEPETKKHWPKNKSNSAHSYHMSHILYFWSPLFHSTPPPPFIKCLISRRLKKMPACWLAPDE